MATIDHFLPAVIKEELLKSFLGQYLLVSPPSGRRRNRKHTKNGNYSPPEMKADEAGVQEVLNKFKENAFHVGAMAEQRRLQRQSDLTTPVARRSHHYNRAKHTTTPSSRKSFSVTPSERGPHVIEDIATASFTLPLVDEDETASTTQSDDPFPNSDVFESFSNDWNMREDCKLPDDFPSTSLRDHHHHHHHHRYHSRHSLDSTNTMDNSCSSSSSHMSPQQQRLSRSERIVSTRTLLRSPRCASDTRIPRSPFIRKSLGGGLMNSPRARRSGLPVELGSQSEHLPTKNSRRHSRKSVRHISGSPHEPSSDSNTDSPKAPNRSSCKSKGDESAKKEHKKHTHRPRWSVGSVDSSAVAFNASTLPFVLDADSAVLSRKPKEELAEKAPLTTRVSLTAGLKSIASTVDKGEPITMASLTAGLKSIANTVDNREATTRVALTAGLKNIGSTVDNREQMQPRRSSVAGEDSTILSTNSHHNKSAASMKAALQTFADAVDDWSVYSIDALDLERSKKSISRGHHAGNKNSKCKAVVRKSAAKAGLRTIAKTVENSISMDRNLDSSIPDLTKMDRESNYGHAHGRGAGPLSLSDSALMASLAW